MNKVDEKLKRLELSFENDLRLVWFNTYPITVQEM
jgi:hypothetical protein